MAKKKTKVEISLRMLVLGVTAVVVSSVFLVWLWISIDTDTEEAKKSLDAMHKLLEQYINNDFEQEIDLVNLRYSSEFDVLDTLQEEAKQLAPTVESLQEAINSCRVSFKNKKKEEEEKLNTEKETLLAEIKEYKDTAAKAIKALERINEVKGTQHALLSVLMINLRDEISDRGLLANIFSLEPMLSRSEYKSLDINESLPYGEIEQSRIIQSTIDNLCEEFNNS